MKYEKKIHIYKFVTNLINIFCVTPLDKHDFSKYSLSPFSTFFSETVTFANGYQADIKARTGDINESAFVEMFLFDEHGDELSCTECKDSINETFEINYENDKYIVKVV